MPAPSVPSSCVSGPTCTPSSKRIERHRWLIQNAETGQYIASVKEGKPVWASHPLDSLTHVSMEVASHNLHKLRDFYKLPNVRLEPVMFYAFPERPTQWFTDYD